jgi:hypothetical protein
MLRSCLIRSSVALAFAALASLPAFAGIVIGTVRNTAGANLSGVVVSPSGGTVSFTTGATGSFSLTLAAGTYLIDFAPPNPATPLYAPTQVFNVVVPASGTVNLGIVTLQAGFILTGTVQTTAGAPLSGADTDVLVASTGVKLLTPGDNTNASGVYSVVVPAGTYTVTADAPAGQLLVSNGVNNVVVTGPGTTTVPLIQLAPGFSLTATVVHATTNAPVANVNIDVEDQYTGVKLITPNDLTDASGVFTVVVPAGVFRISFKPAPGVLLVARQIEFVAIGANFNAGVVTLQPGIQLSGTVLGPGGVPVVGADIDVDATLGPARMYTPYDTTGAAGQYAVVLPAGTYLVSSDGGPGSSLVAGSVGPVTIQAAAVVAPTINLVTGFALSGTVTGWNGLPEAGAFVKVVNVLTGLEVLNPENNTSATGAYAVNVPAGTYDVTFTPKHESLSRHKTIPGVVVAAATTLNTSLQIAQVAAYMAASPGQPTLTYQGLPILLDLAIYHPNPGLPVPPVELTLEFVDPAGLVTTLVPPFIIPLGAGQFVVALNLPFLPPTLPAGQLGFPSRFRFRAVNASNGQLLDADDLKVTIF